MNTVISYNQLQANLDATCNEVCRNHTPVLVKRRKGNVVLVAQEDYDSLLETTYLLKSTANAERLLASLNHCNNDHLFMTVDELKAQLNFM